MSRCERSVAISASLAGLRNITDGGWTRRYGGWFETLPRHGGAAVKRCVALTAARMDATPSRASWLTGYPTARVVRRGPSQAPAYAVAKALAREPEVRRFRIFEYQFHDALALPRFSVG